MYSIENKVLNKIYGRGRGWVFSQIDFATLGNRSAIDVAFHRLVDKGTIRRVSRGIYDYPVYSDLLGKYLSPDIDKVSQAIARKFNWRIQPSGPTALNMLGLSTQVPSKYVYLSDGPSKVFIAGKTPIRFKTTKLKDVGFKHHESASIVSAFRSLGRDRLTPDVIDHTRKWLNPEIRSRVLKDTAKATGWIYSGIRNVCLESSNV
ncbi:MAG: DUF6088 family protein [Candidatus Marinimicrobia bacterium]|nr:DUF6088 family protein [Candidatus Neomarinimicrobiota bacterium]